MNPAGLNVITPGDATLLEIAALAARSGVVLVERGGKTALCGEKAIPEGWHRLAVREKVQGGNHGLR